MKRMLFIICMTIISCTGTDIQKHDSMQTGWNDEDTYTVRATGPDEPNAVYNAHHRILKDIVDVRVRNDSRYRDIEKIRDEFSTPLQNGRILSRTPVPEGLQIYYQIYDRGLKKKFERK